MTDAHSEVPPDLRGKRAIVTGGTSGIGLLTAAGLAAFGADVILTGRERARGERAVAQIRAAHPGARVRFAPLDLAQLASVRDLAAMLAAEGVPVDLLVNNAGVMGIPERRLTVDGFEMQFGVNHLAHFALAGLLLPLLRRAAGSRLVVVASLAHRRAQLRLDNLQGERGYRPFRAYAQSKLANLMFALEFARRSASRKWGVCAIAAHPGWAATNIAAAGPRMGRATVVGWLGEKLFPLLAQSAADGARPTLFAATSPQTRCGGYYGPARWGETRGPPAPAAVAPVAQNREMATALWEKSEALTGIRIS